MQFVSIPRWGDHDEEIRLLQLALKQNGFDPGPLDGQWGQRTELAVRDFQQHSNFTVNGKLDEAQLRALGIKLKNSNPVDVVETPWMYWLAEHEGEHEVDGNKDNPFIMGLYKYGNYQADHDEVPWCACCVNAALRINGYQGTNRADAKSFIGYKDDWDNIKFGAIVVIRHSDGKSYHVSFFNKWINPVKGAIELFGGNQSNALIKKTYNVSGNRYGRDEIVGVYWPIKA